MGRPWPPQRATVLVAIVALVILAGVGTAALSALTPEERPPARAPQELVEPRAEDNVIWPYTSSGRTTAERTLPINVVVYGDAEDVRFYLTQQVDARWNETDEEWQDVDPNEGDEVESSARNGSIVEWATASGARRYVYVHHRALTEERLDGVTRRPHRAIEYQFHPDEPYDGEWIEESYQLHSGDYFGSRDHLRAYESPYESDEWVAIQAHSEHWDWFQLRHTVDGIGGAQKRLESAFMGQLYVDDVWRMYLHNDRGADADGWATVIEVRPRPPTPPGPNHVDAGFVAIAFALSRSARRLVSRIGTGVNADMGSDVREDGLAKGATIGSRIESASTSDHSWRTRFVVDRIDIRYLLMTLRGLSYLLLFASVFVLYLAVRASGVLLEQYLELESPKLVAFSLYPIIAVGLPICTYVFARTIEPARSFILVTIGFGLAIVVDYAYLNVAVLPIDVVLHRLGVVVALGLIAAGASYRRAYLPAVNRWIGVGIVAWVYLLLAPLVGWI